MLLYIPIHIDGVSGSRKKISFHKKKIRYLPFLSIVLLHGLIPHDHRVHIQWILTYKHQYLYEVNLMANNRLLSNFRLPSRSIKVIKKFSRKDRTGRLLPISQLPISKSGAVTRFFTLFSRHKVNYLILS